MKQKKSGRRLYQHLLLKRLLILLCSVNFLIPAIAQELQISGKVTDESGAPMVGVNILIEGTMTGTITGVDGAYSINAPAGSVLVYSFLGYISEKVTVSAQNVIDIQLLPDITALDEVVVIGYGTQRKEAVTGSVASVKDNVIKEVPSSNITSALQGRISGVEMSQVSSKPGAAMQIRIRGTRSISSTNDPLVVLDGIPFGGSLSDIDPNIIKSVDILKDASATAIYGSRGANGVILISTNKGIKGQKAMINYDKPVFCINS